MKHKRTMVIPTHVDLVIDVGDDDRCTFRYRETFADVTIVERTAGMIEAAARAGALPKGATFARDGDNGLVVEGKGVRRVDIGNMMFGEFLMWAAIGDMRLRDFIGAAIRLGQMSGKGARKR